MSSNIENCGKDSNSVDILQLFVQWLTTSGDAIAIVGQEPIIILIYSYGVSS